MTAAEPRVLVQGRGEPWTKPTGTRIAQQFGRELGKRCHDRRAHLGRNRSLA